MTITMADLDAIAEDIRANGPTPRTEELVANLNEGSRALVAAKLANVPSGMSPRWRKFHTLTTRKRAAELLGLRSSMHVMQGKYVLANGTLDEVLNVHTGKWTIGMAYSNVQERLNPPSEGPVRRETNTEVWGHLRAALEHLTSLPLPSDAAAVARRHDRGFLGAHLGRAATWLGEFEREWVRILNVNETAEGRPNHERDSEQD